MKIFPNEIRPILASLRKHRIPVILIVLEIALACAVLCNAVFMISQRVGYIRLPNAIDEQGIGVVSLNGTDDKRVGSDIPRNLAALRGIGGVQAVAVVSYHAVDQQQLGLEFRAYAGQRAEQPEKHQRLDVHAGSGCGSGAGPAPAAGALFYG
jgi:hypothetical protein